MTRRPAAGFSLLFGILLSTTAAHAQPPASADFALKFEFKPCLTSSLDTDKNIYTWELGLGQGSVSTPLFLTTEETATIADAVRRVGFFDYPAVFGGGQPGANGDIVTVTPSTIYRLEVRDAGVVHTVTWNDSSRPHTDAANRLLTLFDLLNRIIGERSEVKRLPVSKAGCE
jgi:hypothetical protein